MLAIRENVDSGNIREAANDALAKEEPQRELSLVAGSPHHHCQRGAANPNFERFLGGELILDPGSGGLVVFQDAGSMGAAVAHRSILANILPVVGDGASAEWNCKPGPHQVGFDPTVERDQSVLRQGDPLGLL